MLFPQADPMSKEGMSTMAADNATEAKEATAMGLPLPVQACKT